ncbi:MAG: helix-hairpin-helix domain-containing protein [Candidatus Methanoperedens sp.]
MSVHMKQSALKEFKHIPGVSKKISLDLWSMGLRSVEYLKDYERQGVQVDRCMLYVFYCAVYYEHDPELLKWWNWKDNKWRINDENPFN